MRQNHFDVSPGNKAPVTRIKRRRRHCMSVYHTLDALTWPCKLRSPIRRKVKMAHVQSASAVTGKGCVCSYVLCVIRSVKIVWGYNARGVNAGPNNIYFRYLKTINIKTSYPKIFSPVVSVSGYGYINIGSIFIHWY